MNRLDQVSGAIIGITLITFASIGFCVAVNPSDQPGNGKTLYISKCMTCHGFEGRGDGPEASTLLTKPADLLSAEVQSKSDEELRTIIAFGKPHSAMRGLKFEKRKLGDVDNIIDYLRRLAERT